MHTGWLSFPIEVQGGEAQLSAGLAHARGGRRLRSTAFG